MIRDNAKPMHIAFGIDNAYAPYIAVTIRSIVENNRRSELRIHVLTNGISEKHLRRLHEAVGDSGRVHLDIHIVDDSALHGLKTGVWTMRTWYRILLPDILPEDVHRVLYLDADTLVTDDLRELFATDMTDRSVAAVIDTQTLDERAFERCGYDPRKLYVCSGVLLMNLDYWRANALADKLADYAERNAERIIFPDQDAINSICCDSKLILPLRYGILNAFFLNDAFYAEPYAEQLRECLERPAIIHYAGCYPWIKPFAVHPLNGEWTKYDKMLTHSVGTTRFPRKKLYIKVLIWQMMHPFRKRAKISADEALRRLSERSLQES